jgi:capsular exopolysaccharide synthesis family protein
MIKEVEAVNPTTYEKLKVIPMGTVPPNQAELLAGARLEELLKLLENDYDFILIDSPPVNIVSDALSISKLVDGVLLVVREGYTTYPEIANTISKYEYVGGKILGFIYNGGSFAWRKESKSNYHYYSK